MNSDEVSEPQIEPRHDRRFLEMGDYEAPAPPDAREQQANQRIQAIHCRLLEAATAGRLTWNGDRIVTRVSQPMDANAHEALDLITAVPAEKPCNP